MNPEKMLRLLEWAQAKLAEGQSMMDVNANIMRISGGEINGFMSLQLAIPTNVRRSSRSEEVRHAATDERNDEVLKTFATASPVQHFVEGMAQGASLGSADDIARIFGNEEFGERLEARRELNPGASFASEAAGLLVPGAAAVKGTRAVVGALGRAGRGSLPRSVGVAAGFAGGGPGTSAAGD